MTYCQMATCNADADFSIVVRGCFGHPITIEVCANCARGRVTLTTPRRLTAAIKLARAA